MKPLKCSCGNADFKVHTMTIRLHDVPLKVYPDRVRYRDKDAGCSHGWDHVTEGMVYCTACERDYYLMLDDNNEFCLGDE